MFQGLCPLCPALSYIPSPFPICPSPHSCAPCPQPCIRYLQPHVLDCVVSSIVLCVFPVFSTLCSAAAGLCLTLPSLCPTSLASRVPRSEPRITRPISHLPYPRPRAPPSPRASLRPRRSAAPPPRPSPAAPPRPGPPAAAGTSPQRRPPGRGCRRRDEEPGRSHHEHRPRRQGGRPRRH